MNYICKSETVVIQPLSLVSGTANAGGLVEVSTTAPHALMPNAIVLVQGVTGTVEANGKWIVASVPDPTHLTLANSLYSRSYVSGGLLTHVGAVLGVVPTPAPGFTITVRLEDLSWASNCRIIFEDATTSSFFDAQALVALQSGPGTGDATGQYLTLQAATFGALPDVRAGFLRCLVYMQRSWTSATLSSWTV
jgi:hypothetical protein